MSKLKYDNKMLEAHKTYRDIMPNGIKKYPFAKSRMEPIFYEIKPMIRNKPLRLCRDSK